MYHESPVEKHFGNYEYAKPVVLEEGLVVEGSKGGDGAAAASPPGGEMVMEASSADGLLLLLLNA